MMTKVVKTDKYPVYLIVPPVLEGGIDVELSKDLLERIFKAEEEWEACQQLIEEKYNEMGNSG